MKRILSLILILILSLGVLSSCQWPGNDPVEPPVTEPVYNIDNAVSYLKTVHPELYPTKDMPVPETKADFHLLKVLSVKDGKYTISWSVDNEAIQIVDYVPANDKDIFTAETKCTVKVPANVSEDLTYTLTATITAPDGKTTKTVDHTLKVPAPVIVGGKATLDMMGTANITSYSTEKVVYTANGITYINEKAKSTTDCYNQTKDYAARAYAGSTIRIEFKGMRKIVITVDDYDGNGKTYMAGLDGMIVEGATITREHDIITIVFDEAVDAFQSTNLSSQIRIETIEVYTSLDGTEPDGGEDKPTGDYTAPALNTAFKLYIELPSGKVYFKGVMDSTYLATTTDVTAGVDIYFEEVDGGYHMYFMNGEAKTYINAAPYQKDNGYMGCHFELGEAPICTWTYDATYGIFEVTCEMEGVESDTFFAGTYGSYSTVSLSGSYYKPQIATGTQYPARLVLSSEAGTENPNPHEHSFVNGKCECGETDPNYQPPVTEGLAIVTTPEAGVAYKFGLYHGNESANVFFNGENYNNYAWYFAYTTDVAGAVDVYLETVEGVEGGYRLYFDNNGVKTYMVAFPRDGDTTKGTLKFDTVVPSEYYTFSAEHNTLIYTSTTGEQFYIGSSGTYTSISLSAISYITSATSYISHLYAEGGNSGEVTPPPHTHTFVDGKCACGEEDPNYVPPQADTNALTSLKTGDKVYIVAPAYNMALSATKVATYYNKGVDVSGGFAGLTDAEIWEVTVNDDGSYTFTSLTGKVLALAADYASLNDTGVNKSWTLEAKSEGIFYVKNTVRGNYLEWYASKSNWSTYATSSLSDLFEISFYAYELAEGDETPAPHEHTFVEGKCECGEEDPNYVPPVEGGDEVVTGGSADFDSLLPGSNGSSAYTGTYTTTNGWVVTNSAVQAGGATVVNPQFPVIGADNTSKAVCLNGKTSAIGKLTSPTLNGGISKLTMEYTKMFTDTKLSVTITITDLTTGAVYTQVVEREEAKDTKYVVWTFEWVLDTAIEGDFTIEIVNNCPTAQNSNKDRITILDLSWTK